MQLAIDPNPYVKTPIANTFEVRIEALHDDGNAYREFVFSDFFKDRDEAALKHLLTVLTQVGKADKQEDAIGDFSRIEGFNDWFYGDWVSENRPPRAKQDAVLGHARRRQEWPVDAYEEVYRFDGYEVIYFDENRLGHRVRVTL